MEPAIAVTAEAPRHYVLEAIDRAGCTFTVGRFASMEELVASLKGNRPAGCGFTAYNSDRHDCDGYGTEEESYSDGLTEDERDLFMEVL